MEQNTAHPPVWDPFKEWKPVKVKWKRVDISTDDLRRFTKRSNVKGLCQAIGFLLFFTATGGFAYWAFLKQNWVIMAIALYIHGTFYAHFGDALHELGHNRVFASKPLNKFFTNLYGLLYWTWNPYFYHLSHQNYHHRYTLHQNSDGEDAPNYIEFKPRLIYELFFKVIRPVVFIRNVARLFTLKPTASYWRGGKYKLDAWERFILSRATDKQSKQIYRFSVFNLITQVVFVTVCVISGLWFLPVLITLAPFYGANFHTFMCTTHQHTACEANNPDFKIICGDAILDPLSSFLYWHMEYHTEHHMYAGIPCYNLKKFSKFVADQMPKKQHAIPRLFKLNRLCAQKYGNFQNWRDNFGRYKGL